MRLDRKGQLDVGVGVGRVASAITVVCDARLHVSVERLAVAKARLPVDAHKRIQSETNSMQRSGMDCVQALHGSADGAVRLLRGGDRARDQALVEVTGAKVEDASERGGHGGEEGEESE